MAVSQVSASFNLSVCDACTPNSPRLCTISRLPTSNFARNATSFVKGSPLVIRTSSAQLKAVNKSNSSSIKCQQSANESGLDVWLGRIAMIGFAVAITVEVSTGKGLLEERSTSLQPTKPSVSQNFGLTSPLPTVALAVTGLVGVLTAVFIFQSASKN